MKGIFRSTPPKPRLGSVWKVVDALNWVSTLEPIETLYLKELSLKVALLLAPTSAARAHELAKLNLDSVSMKRDSWEFFLSCHVKSSRPGHPPRRIYLPAYHKDPSICVVRTLVSYKEKTNALRKSNQLLISFIKPHSAISTQTVSRWLRNALSGAGIDIGRLPPQQRKQDCPWTLLWLLPIGYRPRHLNSFTTNLLDKVHLHQ